MLTSTAGLRDFAGKLARPVGIFERGVQRGTKVRDCGLPRRSVTDCADAKAKPRQGAPHAVLVLLHDVRYANDADHGVDYGIP